MADRLDQILVIDVESTCWRGEPPPGQYHEIIEIGLCTLDIASAQRLENRCILVRPERSTVSSYCTSLTTLTQEDVDGGIPLDEACRILQQGYHSKERLWASYGDYDRRQFERNCRLRHVPYPFGPGHINVKSLFAIAHNLSREIPLDKAMEALGFPLEGTHHRGADDAWNIARILGDLLLRVRQKPSPVEPGQPPISHQKP
jgi:inhibitor of KinA sporulation pathway (predicted exonuclease)